MRALIMTVLDPRKIGRDPTSFHPLKISSYVCKVPFYQN